MSASTELAAVAVNAALSHEVKNVGQHFKLRKLKRKRAETELEIKAKTGRQIRKTQSEFSCNRDDPRSVCMRC